MSDRSSLHARHPRRDRSRCRAADVVSRPAVFLDRDGTIIEEVGYLDAIEQIVWFPWSIDAIRALNQAGLAVVLATNQSGVARRYFTEDFVRRVHRALDERLAAGGARIDAYYYCPHHPEGAVEEYRLQCDCRKPAGGLATQAARDLDLDLPRSYVVGDTWRDVGLARSVGARGLLVRTGRGAVEETRPNDGLAADAVVDNLAAAASWILMHR
jgi:D-glycero-D-manno-heptose 1,7-bisphosphate phosphatase